MKSRTAAAHWANLFTVLWIFFWILTGLAALAWPLGWGEVQLHERLANGDLRDALGTCLRWLDAGWITLAAVNIYLAAAAQEGLATARRWAITVFGGSTALLALGAGTGWPFGPIIYTDQLGPRLFGLVPAALPLLWFVIIVAARLTFRLFFPRMKRWPLALAIGGVAAISSLCLELIAWKIRAWWLWSAPIANAPAGAPFWQNLAAWLVAGTLLGAALRERSIQPSATARRGRPLAVLAAIHAVCLLTWLAWRLR